MSKGVSEEIIEEKLAKLLDDESEKEKCLRFGEKYLKGKMIDIKTKQKFFNHLAGKGYGFGQISKAWEVLTNDRD